MQQREEAIGAGSGTAIGAGSGMARAGAADAAVDSGRDCAAWLMLTAPWRSFDELQTVSDSIVEPQQLQQLFTLFPCARLHPDNQANSILAHVPKAIPNRDMRVAECLSGAFGRSVSEHVVRAYDQKVSLCPETNGQLLIRSHPPPHPLVDSAHDT